MKKLIILVVAFALMAGTAFAGSNDWNRTNTYNNNHNYNKDVAMAQTIAGYLLGAQSLLKAPNGGDVAYRAPGGAAGGVAQPDNYRENSRNNGYYGNNGYHGNYRSRDLFYTQSTYPQQRPGRHSGYQGVCRNIPIYDGYGRVVRVDTYCK